MSEERPVPKVRLGHYLEYILFRFLIASLRLLGWKGARRFGEMVGRFGFSVLRIRRTLVENQVSFAFPGLSREQVQEIAKASYEHLGRTAVEAILLGGRDQKAVLAMEGGVEGWEFLEQAVAQGRGVILVSGHIGNWELAGSYLSARGIRLAAVARRMSNPLFDRYISATRERLGVRIVYEADAVRAAPRLLRDGGTLVLLADQGVRGLASIYVPFFGRLARTPKGAGVLAARFDVPVVFGLSVRLPNGKYKFVLEPLPRPNTGDRDRDVDELVAAFTASLERWVRRYPEQYFWVHRRWRKQPPGMPPVEDHELSAELVT